MATDNQTQKPPTGGAGPGWRHSLSVRLFWLTVAVVLLVELVVFVPSATAFRANWLEERAQAARIASLAVEAAPSRRLSMELSDSLLESAEILALTELDRTMRIRLLPAAESIPEDVLTVDLRQESYMTSVSSTFSAFFAPKGRAPVIVDHGAQDDRVIEVVVREAPLKSALWGYGGRILALSLLVSAAAGGLVFAVL